MSQWNNSYNQYQEPNTWEGNMNSHYVNQQAQYYPPDQRQYDPSAQYVGFNEFLSQIQNNSVSQAGGNSSYSNTQYQNYQTNQYNSFGGTPSTSQSNHQDYNYVVSPGPSEKNGEVNYHQHPSSESPSDNSYKNDVAAKSNLTATATEFVPQSSNYKQPKNYKQKKQTEPTSSNNSSYNSRNNRNSSKETNWRDRPSSSGQQGEVQQQNETSQRNHDSNHRNQEIKSRNGESNSRNEYKNDKNYERKNQENNRQESNGQESYQKNQSKNNSRNKNKELDAGRTFYNSKSSQDVRSVRNDNRNRNWTGSQRVRTAERNTVDDEQFANSYLQYRDDRSEPRERVGKVQGSSSPLRNNKQKYNNYHNNKENESSNPDLTQRERLTDQLDRGTLECLVCCERVKQTDSVWSCGNCYHVLHLRCIRKWAMSSMLEGKWRCPACQNSNEKIPADYVCMCGSVRNPEWQRGSGCAHTCGKPCRRERICPHPCTLLCHPGPCPPCQATVTKQCGCGAETRSVLCSSKLAQVCGGPCQKLLNCEVHQCDKTCHEGPCDTCQETVTQVCHCPSASSRETACGPNTPPAFSCGDACGRALSCGQHVCRRMCHAPPCGLCDRHPSKVHTCPCGNTRIEEGQRTKCTDPIPLCDKICTKPLSCGPAGDKHFCKEECHEGDCPVCPDKTVLQCRCGHSSREVPCADLPQMIDNVFCQKKCNKKLSCGRHRCRTLCCGASSHQCGAVCGRPLSCQTHRCERLCHTGHCAPCPRLSFTELRCACGREVSLPPVQCGARPPLCSAPCSRPRPCGHEALHQCHAGDCPPCLVLTPRHCYGRHEERKTILCSQEEFSCGLPCGKPLPCGKHTCIKTCHKGPCDTGKCTQPCAAVRPCGHGCGAACHWSAGGVCPSPAPCRRPVTATCVCGRRKTERTCADNAAVHQKMMAAQAASKIQEGGSVDLSELNRPGSNLKTLECDDECRVEQRTRQMALALQIRNPDVSSKLAPRYSDHVRAWAAKDPAFARNVHDALTDLVQRAKKSKQKTRSHSFPSMNWQKRQFIHELCEHFGCESVAYDAEPNRNVVATADREKSWLPAMSVWEVVSREAGRRRVPGPVLRHGGGKGSTSGWATLKSTNAWASRAQPKQPETKVDYFDNPPE